MNKDQDIRPKGFDTFVGQRDTIAVLRRAVVAARTSGRPCGHVLLAGMPGCGKTSLAAVVANEMGTKLTSAVCPAFEHRGELTSLLTGLDRNDVLFLDEIHGLDRKLQESLYTAMEDGVVDLSAGRKMIRLPLMPFTLVGATTRTHLLTGPLRDRFAYTFQLGHYKADELTLIASRTAQRIGLSMDKYAADEIGRRARGTPRIANRLVLTCRDFAESAGLRHVEVEAALAVFEALGVDSAGLDATDRAYLAALVDRGGPMGAEALATQLGQERGTVENVVEPHLVEAGFVVRTPKGRVATARAVAHLQEVKLTQREPADLTEDAELLS